MRYRLLCLDAGFTLLQPRRTLAEALGALLAERGHPAPTDDALRTAWEVADRWFWDEYHREGNDTWRSDDRIVSLWRSYHGMMLGSLGIRDPQHELIEAILAAQFAADAWDLYPDVEPMLEEAAGAVETIGIVSDWGSNLADIVRQCGLDRWVRFVLASGAEGLAKPDPAFFELALERAGVRPEEALMVGDSWRADVQGARTAGLDAVLLDRPGSHGPADVPVIRSLLELPAIVRGEVPATPSVSG